MPSSGQGRSECTTKVSPNKNQKAPAGQSNKKKTMVARSHEDCEEAFTCVKLQSGNSKNSNSNRLTSNDEAIYSAACRAQSNDGLHWSRQVEWMASEGTMRYWMYGDDCG